MKSARITPVAVPRALGVEAADQGLTDRLAAVSWVTVFAGEEVLVVPSELFRLCAFVPSNAARSRAVELSLAGLQTKPGVFVTPHDGCMIVALLTPLGVAQLLRAPLRGTADRRILLDGLCPPDELEALAERVRGAASHAIRARVLRQWIEQRMRTHPPLGESLTRVCAAAKALAQPDSGERVGPLAVRMGITQRQLERDFRDWIGVPPATFGRLARLQRAARALAEGRPPATAAFDSGFADQPHLNRSARAMTLLTPSELQVHGTRDAPSALRRVLADRLLFMSQPGEMLGRSRVDALPTGCPLTRFMQSVRDARRAMRHRPRDRSQPIPR